MKVAEKLKAIVNSFPVLDEETEAMSIKRAKACSNCTFSKSLNKSMICKQGGRYLPTKIISPQEKCPLNKWE